MFGFGPKVPSVSVEDVKKALDETSDCAVLDVRTSEEYTRGHIKGSINLPVNVVATSVEKILSDKNKTIYVYCLSGSRSNQAVGTMLKLDYKNVFDIKSGLLAWRSKKYPLES